ncbi:cell division protein FtsZ [Owenweeksia hongkongensis]|uniref:cell division protein FtsZ n=1 Tax=Owenweeksia hongkongensis TaxID=253245 RepID=UPI003A93C18B
MSDQNGNDTIAFDLPKNQSSVIKVIGVGGGGSNAVNHMHGMGIRGVDFVICNTDSQALSNSPVPNKVQLGVTLTEGLGAGANPEVGQQAALESIEEVKNLLETNTKMVFITAGMGGGTGTGAAPVIAKAAKDAGILTVGICTIPFLFEGNNRKLQAEKGVEALRSSVDSLIVINNNKLREVYGNLGFKAGFSKADEVLATAARGIAEVITHHYTTNIDLRDARTVLADSGTAIMGSASASGENRASEAIRSALDSPLLNDNHIKGAKNVLLLIVSGKEEITIDEIGEINDFIQMEAGNSANIIMGIGDDEALGEEISVTIVATGFSTDQQEQVIGHRPTKVVHTLEDEQPISASVFSKPLAQEREEDNDEDFINKELAKHTAKQQKPQFQQPNLFEMDAVAEEEEIIEEPQFEAPVAPEEAPLPPSMKEEEEVVAKAPQQEVSQPVAPEPIEEPVAEEEEEPVFHIGSIEIEEEEDDDIVHFTLNEDEEEEETAPAPQAEVKETPAPQAPIAETPKEEEPKPMETPTPQREVKPIRYSLEDYMNLEQQLKSAKPGQTPASAPKPAAKVEEEKEDDSLRFEIKQVNKPEQPAPKARVEEKRVAPQRPHVAPTEYTIEESMRMKAEERRTKMKAFNYRFKNNPFGNDDADNEPAYKRQGVKIEETRYSTESNVSRFSIDDSNNGPDIKTNNSFLHDNVD